MRHELEQFLGLGNEVAFWIFSYRNIGGLIGGGLLGSRVGQALGGSGLTFLLAFLVGVLGLVLTLNWRGLMVGRRLVLRAQFYLRAATQPRLIDAATFYTVIERRERPIVVRKDGATIMAPKTAQQNGGPA